MKNFFHPLLIALFLWPALSLAQSIFIDSPSEGETVIGPTVTIRMSVTDFDLGQDGRIRIQVDGNWVEDTERPRATVAVPPGTHQVEARLVDRRGKRIDTVLAETVKFTVKDDND